MSGTYNLIAVSHLAYKATLNVECTPDCTPLTSIHFTSDHIGVNQVQAALIQKHMYRVLYSIAALVRVLRQTRTMACSWNVTKLNTDEETRTHHHDEAFKYHIKCLSAICTP